MRRTIAMVVFTAAVVACGGGSGGSAGVPDDLNSASSAPGSDSAVDDSTVETDDGDGFEALLNSEPVYADLILDGATTVEAIVTVADGGEVTTTSASGDVYRVVIPPGALPVDTVISVTAASDGVVSGVNIEPDGLPLNELAVVEMTPAAGRDYADFVWWDGTGELHRPIAGEGDDGVIRFLTGHFSGYGGSTDTQSVVESPVDEVVRQIASDVSDAAKRMAGDETVGSELQKTVSDRLEPVWKKYLRQRVKDVGKSGCTAREIYREALKIRQLAHVFGVDSLDEWIAGDMEKYANDFYAAMKACARQKCSEGNLNAPSIMVWAVSSAQTFDSSEALEYGMSDLREVFAEGVGSFWSRCRVFDVTLTVRSTWEFGDQTFGATLQGVATGKGSVVPVTGGVGGVIGTYESGSGWADFTSRFGTTLMTGLTSLIAGELTERNLTCSESNSGRGQVNITLQWGEDGPPELVLEPLSSPLTVTCSSDLGTNTGQMANPAYLLLTLDFENELWSSTIEHRFTEDELWPVGYGAPIGYLWQETFDFLPILAAEDGGLTRRAEASVYVKIVLGSPRAPKDAIPPSEGLVPADQGMTPVTTVP